MRKEQLDALMNLREAVRCNCISEAEYETLKRQVLEDPSVNDKRGLDGAEDGRRTTSEGVSHGAEDGGRSGGASDQAPESGLGEVGLRHTQHTLGCEGKKAK